MSSAGARTPRSIPDTKEHPEKSNGEGWPHFCRITCCRTLRQGREVAGAPQASNEPENGSPRNSSSEHLRNSFLSFFIKSRICMVAQQYKPSHPSGFWHTQPDQTLDHVNSRIEFFPSLTAAQVLHLLAKPKKSYSAAAAAFSQVHALQIWPGTGFFMCHSQPDNQNYFAPKFFCILQYTNLDGNCWPSS